MTGRAVMLQVPPAPVSWTARQIHDTVALIAVQRKFAPRAAASLLGRFLRYLGDRIAQLITFFQGRADARWIVGAAIVLVAIAVLARVAVERSAAMPGRRRSLGAGVARGHLTDYWQLASDDAAAGQYAHGCHALYAAVLDALVREGSVAFHASKTSGDYALELRRTRHPRQAVFLAFVREFDRAVFAHADTSAADFNRVRDAAARVLDGRMAA